MISRQKCSIFSLLLLVFWIGSFSGEPFSYSIQEPSGGNFSSEDPLYIFAKSLLQSYQKGLSPLDGPTCQFHPSCSGYARKVMRTRGFFFGILSTGDRLLRCNPQAHQHYQKSIEKNKLLDFPEE
ncbi:MAG: membrane protein insertion efficiency factor YidD [Fibrobacteria bacterium]|nr:membrane protein insertion efficiency factor YidD [Fibrobacteria bacterium]